MKYFIKTFGCQMNVSDSERIAGFLEAHKIKPAKDISKANIVIFNTCGVRQTAEDRVYGLVHNIRKEEVRRKKKVRRIIFLTGCLANRKDVQRKLKDKVDLFCEIKTLPQSLSSFFLLPASLDLDCNYLNTTPKYTNKHEAYVPIMTGCNNFCSYCVVPYARGREVSRPVKDIISEIETLTKKGCEEITLLGQNVNSYHKTWNMEHGTKNIKKLKIKNSKLIENCKLKIENYKAASLDFPILLDVLANSYPKVSFKFLTSHPKDFSDELIDVIAKNKNISREIHLPVQAGSDKILRLMNRPYTRKKYLSLIEKIKKKIPGVGFTTDVIVGFPGETEKDFQETVKVFEKVKYNEAYINKYSPRPGTAAHKLGDPIPWEEKKRRERILRDCLNH